MKKIFLLAIAALCFTACHKPQESNIIKDAVTDVDGNKYDAVRLGDQIWMASNLKTTHFADGTEIPMGVDGDIIYDENGYLVSTPTEPLRYYPNGNESNVNDYGYLYNWYAVMHGESSSNATPSGVQGICPDGWHVPSNAEWNQMIQYVSGEPTFVHDSISIAKALASNYGWEYFGQHPIPELMGTDPTTNNTTGFSVLPAGYYGGGYDNFGKEAHIWTTTDDGDPNYAYIKKFSYRFSVIGCTGECIGWASSVRCVKTEN